MNTSSVPSTDAGAGRDVDVDRGEAEDLVAAGGQDHPLGRHAADRSGFEVGEEDDPAADQRLGGVALGDPGDDLAGPRLADVELEAEQLPGALDRLGDADHGDPEVEAAEVGEGDRGRGRG